MEDQLDSQARAVTRLMARLYFEVILVCIRWYMAYPLSYWHLEEMMEERGVSVDHSSINRWAIRFLPLVEKMARKHKRPVGGS